MNTEDAESSAEMEITEADRGSLFYLSLGDKFLEDAKVWIPKVRENLLNQILLFMNMIGRRLTPRVSILDFNKWMEQFPKITIDDFIDNYESYFDELENEGIIVHNQ